jgi:hypothetical protein
LHQRFPVLLREVDVDRRLSRNQSTTPNTTTVANIRRMLSPANSPAQELLGWQLN